MASRRTPAGGKAPDGSEQEELSEKGSPSWESCDLDTRCALLDYEGCYCFEQCMRDYLPEADV